MGEGYCSCDGCGKIIRYPYASERSLLCKNCYFVKKAMEKERAEEVDLCNIKSGRITRKIKIKTGWR